MLLTVAQIFSPTLDADIAYLLLVVGLLAVALEIIQPGGFVAGTLGALLLVVAGLMLADLPVNELGVILIIAGIGLLIAETFVPGGIIGVLGLVAVIGGGLTLYDRASDTRVSIGVLIGVAVAVGAFALVVFRALLRTRRSVVPPQSTADLIGHTALVEQAIDPAALEPNGVVRAGSESWTARAPVRIEAGAEVRIANVDGFTLEVEPLSEEETR